MTYLHPRCCQQETGLYVKTFHIFFLHGYVVENLFVQQNYYHESHKCCSKGKCSKLPSYPWLRLPTETWLPLAVAVPTVHLLCMSLLPYGQDKLDDLYIRGEKSSGLRVLLFHFAIVHHVEPLLHGSMGDCKDSLLYHLHRMDPALGYLLVQVQFKDSNIKPCKWAQRRWGRSLDRSESCL